MKTFGLKFLFSTFFLLLILPSCFNKPAKQEVANAENIVNDTTEILKVPFSNNPSKIEYEISVLKGTKTMHGIRKRFYPHGSVYSEGRYVNGKKNGITYTYYQEYGGAKPKIWKEQPYVDGKMEGICRRFHKNEKLQAEYEYKGGLPAIGFKEWNESGKEVTLPKLNLTKEVVNHQTYISARMSNNTKNVKYYSGNLVEGKFVPKNLIPLFTKDGKGELTIPHTSNQKSVTIIAELSTRYWNKYNISKTIRLE